MPQQASQFETVTHDLIVIDTETTGLPGHTPDPRVVQVAWACYTRAGRLDHDACHILLPNGWTIPDAAAALHGITTAHARQHGIAAAVALGMLAADLAGAQMLAGHNLAFDERMLSTEYQRLGQPFPYRGHCRIDTMQLGTPLCALPGRHGYKWPRLSELHQHLFGADFAAHHAADDVAATARCLFELQRRGLLHLPERPA